MRAMLCSLLVFPVIVTAQINRSAREFASEQIKEYVTTKLFKDFSYKPGDFGPIKPYNEKRDSPIAWALEHKFEITETKKTADQKATTPKKYKFQFYLDEKMKVIKAESFFSY